MTEFVNFHYKKASDQKAFRIFNIINLQNNSKSPPIDFSSINL